MAANLTDCLSRTRSPPSCERCLHPQLGDRRFVIPGPGPQPDQLGPLRLAQRGIRVLPGLRGLSCHLHPLAQCHLVDADVPGDLSDRTATVDDKSYRLLLVLRRKCAACRTHFSLSRRIGQLSRLSTEAGTVQCHYVGLPLAMCELLPLRLRRAGCRVAFREVQPGGSIEGDDGEP